MNILFRFLILILLLTACSKLEEKPKETKKENVKEDPCKILIENFNGKFFENLEQREEILLYSKGSPVLFYRKPKYLKSNNRTVLKLRKALEESNNPWNLISSLNLKYNFKQNREIFLKEGYLYPLNKHAAYAYFQFIKLENLFDSDFVYIKRANNILVAKKMKTGYYFVDDNLSGLRANLLIFDKVSSNLEDLVETLHLDISSIKERYSINQITELKYNNSKLFISDINGKYIFSDNDNSGNLVLECGSPKLNNSNIKHLQWTILKNVDDRLPFDEPIHEFGEQMDGKLRPAWLNAFYKKQFTFYYTTDKYSVYNERKKPLIPEVCVDFIIDSIDRTAGSWYERLGKRTKGSFDSKDFEKDYTLRNISGFKQFALDHSNWFQVTEYKDKTELGSKSFFSSIKEKDLQIGDIVFIKGETPWDKIEEHSHSFFIFDKDLVSGYPTILAGNAGPASLRSWEIERKRTPKRYIFMKIRMKNEFINLISKNQKNEIQIILR